MSTLKVTNLQKLDGSQFPVGKILNAYNVGYSTQLAITSTAYTDFLSKTLTPVSSSSTFIIQCSIHAWNQDTGQNSTWGIRCLRDSTAVYQPSVLYEISSENAVSNGHVRPAWSLSDSPSSSSQIVYKIQLSTFNNADVTFNRGSYFRSDMTIFEVGA